ncbi:alpha/beta hydrolase [Agrilactobacillus fermenti]|uniref:alpha/beta hydrolase n=1 Tax=Agrilactobacillus fermenti TaxID=2586909 RepID=UPI001E4E1C3A|nr:alpha/beta hydrolase [Agrilactobacillus fermenti]MCD2255595.1 alpha/beta hydrolase [Agrilactobacillus fermenti]
MKYWQRLWRVGLLLVILLISVTACSKHTDPQASSRSSKSKTTKIKYQKVGPNVTPVIYLHGFGSSPKAMAYLVDQARLANNNTSDIIATVQDNGDFQLSQNIIKGVQYPLIRVQLASSRYPSDKTARIMSRFLRKLKQTYGIQQFDAVGHSAGAGAWIDYAINYAHESTQPHLQKVATLAVTVNGWIGSGAKGTKPNTNQVAENGRPAVMTPGYKQLWQRRKQMPNQIQFLNVFGNLEDGSNSDGRVTVASARSLKYLVSSRAQHYEEVEVQKTKAQHSQLRENPDVAKVVNQFLFNKK